LWHLGNDLATIEPFQQGNIDMEWRYLKNQMISH